MGLLRGTSDNQFAHPPSTRTVQDGLAVTIFHPRAHSPTNKLSNNTSLSCLRFGVTTSASAGVLNRQMEGRRPGSISYRRITPCVKQAPYGGSATRADGSMKRRRAVLVLRVQIGTDLKQTLNHPHLTPRIPAGGN
jgi:hypothetical protein